jgi:hypothetical protein
VNKRLLIRAVRFCAVYAAGRTAHAVGDYYVQTSHQATRKGQRTREGQLACAGHVASYTVTQVVVLLAVNRLLGLGLSARAVAAGQLVSAITHYFMDREYTAEAMHKAMGRSEFHQLGMPGTPFTGGKMLDQCWHEFWLFVAALVTAVLTER